MSEKTGLAGIWEDLNENLIVSVQTREDAATDPLLPLVTSFTVTNGANQSEATPDILYDEVSLTVGVPPDLHVVEHKNLAGGESFSYEHRSPYSDLGRIVFDVAGVVSPLTLLQVRRAKRSVPPGKANLSMTSFAEVLRSMDLHRWLKGTIASLVIPSSDTTLSEIEAEQDRLRAAAKEISDTRKQLESVSSFISRPKDDQRRSYNEHAKLVQDYLTRTAQACAELAKMLDTLNAKTLTANRDSTVYSLSKDASRVDEAIDELLTG